MPPRPSKASVAGSGTGFTSKVTSSILSHSPGPSWFANEPPTFLSLPASAVHGPMTLYDFALVTRPSRTGGEGKTAKGLNG